MKRVCYVLIHPVGPAIATVSAQCQQHESNEVNLDLFRPDAIRGQLQVNVKAYMDAGYQLSNWHVVESEDETLCSKRDWHARL